MLHMAHVHARTHTHTIRINLRRFFHLVIQYIPCFRYGPLEEIISTSMNQTTSVSWPPFRFEIISFCQRVAILLPLVVINHTAIIWVLPFLHSVLDSLVVCFVFCMFWTRWGIGQLFWESFLFILFSISFGLIGLVS